MISSGVTCLICNKVCGRITYNHLRMHGLTFDDYLERFPSSDLVSIEVKNKLSTANDKRWKDPEFHTKMRLAHLGYIPSEETRKQISSSLSNIPKTEDHKKKVGDSNRGKVRSESTKSLLSEVRSRGIASRSILIWNKGLTASIDSRVEVNGKRISEARLDPLKYRSSGRIKGYYFSTKLNDNIPYRSSYELAYLKQLESDPLVVRYEYEVLRLKYEWNGKDRITIPDFLVHYTDDHTELVEVKSDWCLDRPDVQAKLEAMKRYASGQQLDFQIDNRERSILVC